MLWGFRTGTIYLADSDAGEAWQLYLTYEFDVSYLRKMAIVFAQDIPKASALYIQMAEQCVNKTNNESYRQAIALLQEMAALSKSTEHQSNMAKELDRMREKFRFKRNFIKWLNEAFPAQETMH